MEVNEEYLKTLVSIGFEESLARKALTLTQNDPDLAVELITSGELEEAYKMVVVVRTDLGMGTGKIAAQVGHAVLGCYQRHPNRQSVEKWDREGAAKIVLRVETKEELDRVVGMATEKGLNSYVVEDAGRTQIEPGSVTCVGIGPDLITKIDEVTGSLKLFK